MVEQRFKEWKYPKIEDGKLTDYNWLVQNKDGFKLGYKTDIGAFTYINAKFGVAIEDYSLSTIDNKEGKVVLKKNCRIGAHSVVMPGITIGENSIIGAFSLVNQDIPDNVLAHGIPARIIRKLTKEEIKKLCEEIK